jgi:activator of HSP90 ATPase
MMATTFTQSLLFNASPAVVYSLYADQKLHAAATGSAATIKAKAGIPFTAWDGYISGVTLHAEKDRMIVQTWRTTDWPSEAPDSVFILLFLPASVPEGQGTRLLVTHANVPDDQADELKKGWSEYYWKPWKAWIKRSAAAKPA